MNLGPIDVGLGWEKGTIPDGTAELVVNVSECGLSKILLNRSIKPFY